MYSVRQNRRNIRILAKMKMIPIYEYFNIYDVIKVECNYDVAVATYLFAVTIILKEWTVHKFCSCPSPPDKENI